MILTVGLWILVVVVVDDFGLAVGFVDFGYGFCGLWLWLWQWVVVVMVGGCGG